LEQVTPGLAFSRHPHRTYNDTAFNAGVGVFKEPDFDARALLQKREDDVDGLQQDTLRPRRHACRAAATGQPLIEKPALRSANGAKHQWHYSLVHCQAFDNDSRSAFQISQTAARKYDFRSVESFCLSRRRAQDCSEARSSVPRVLATESDYRASVQLQLPACPKVAAYCFRTRIH
jgi:hypothetical protein